MLVVVICAHNYRDAFNKITIALSYPIDIIELRLDYFNRLKIIEIEKLKNNFSIPMLFTLRKKSQGGLFRSIERERLKIIKNLFELQPEYFDLEHDTDKVFIRAIHQEYPKIKLICSYHNFKKTPNNLAPILNLMISKEFAIYKIVTMATSTIDSLRMLNFVQQYRINRTICGLCMGEFGQATRILSPIVNNCLNYVSLDSKQKNVPGQLSLQELFDIYNYQNINKKTHIYALLGNPVIQSIGHIFHNHEFKKMHKNAVYLKLQIKKEELLKFFQEASKLPFKGYSVTMPLKESIVPFVKLVNDVKKIKAVNTILCKKKQLLGFNTDGIGVLNVIEKNLLVKNKNIVILGAGGTSRAIIHEALKRGAKVVVLNRTLKRAKVLANVFNCKCYSLSYIKKIVAQGYDILINATSIGMNNIPYSISKEIFLKGVIVLDMVYKSNLTSLLQKAKAKKCFCISGNEVFVLQAVEQIKIWFQLQ